MNAQSGFPGIAWPLTGRYWAMATNIWKVRNPKHYLYGTSPWIMRYGHDFPGKRIPFGAKVRYLPNPTNVLDVENQGWHSPTWIDGVFVYWPLESGEWHGKYVVIPEEDLVGVNP